MLLTDPILSWGALAAIPSAGWRAINNRDRSRTFIVFGYLGYLLMWLPIKRFKFLYHYMPALYLGLLALAAELADCWEGRAQTREETILLASLLPAVILDVGAVYGIASAAFFGTVYWAFGRERRGRLVCAGFLVAAGAAFIFFFPIWVGLGISHTAFQQRMWLKGPGIADWR